MYPLIKTYITKKMQTITPKKFMGMIKKRTCCVLDVRTDDLIGGHFSQSTHIPSSDYASIKKFIGEATEDDIVVYCMYSQVRGYGTAAKLVCDFPKKRIWLLKGGFCGLFNYLIKIDEKLISNLDWTYWKKVGDGTRLDLRQPEYRHTDQ